MHKKLEKYSPVLCVKIDCGQPNFVTRCDSLSFGMVFSLLRKGILVLVPFFGSDFPSPLADAAHSAVFFSGITGSATYGCRKSLV